jgi:hypothetical protein
MVWFGGAGHVTFRRGFAVKLWSGLEGFVGQGLVSFGGLGSATRGMARSGWSRRSGFGSNGAVWLGKLRRSRYAEDGGIGSGKLRRVAAW